MLLDWYYPLCSLTNMLNNRVVNFVVELWMMMNCVL